VPAEIINPTTPDGLLMSGLLRGDPRCLQELYDRYAPAVFSLAYRIAGERSIAEESTQDVFLQVWQEASRYDAARGTVSSWLLTIARSRTLDRLRWTQVRTGRLVAVEDLDEYAVGADSPEASAVTTQRSDMLESVLELLPQGDRALLDLAYFRGMTQTEIAATTGLPLGTVKTCIRRALTLLRTAISQTGTAAFSWRPRAAAVTDRANRTPLCNLRILIVDDDGDTVKLLTLVLERAGASVVAASSAAQAIVRLHGMVPDVLITDLGMPGQDGYDLLRRVRGMQLRALPAVAFSAHHDDVERARTTAAGFDLHLPKPVRPSVFVERLTQLVRPPQSNNLRASSFLVQEQAPDVAG